MKATLTLNGKDYEVELTKEQASEIENVDKPNTGFGSHPNSTTYYIDEHQTAFSSEKLRNDYIRAINIFLNLSEWQALNDVPITKEIELVSIIRYNTTLKCLEVESIFNPINKEIMQIAFGSREKAWQAIDVFRKDLMWYFTEFKPRLDM